jgi:hypothetical protein
MNNKIKNAQQRIAFYLFRGRRRQSVYEGGEITSQQYHQLLCSGMKTSKMIIPIQESKLFFIHPAPFR